MLADGFEGEGLGQEALDRTVVRVQVSHLGGLHPDGLDRVPFQQHEVHFGVVPDPVGEQERGGDASRENVPSAGAGRVVERTGGSAFWVCPRMMNRRMGPDP